MERSPKRRRTASFILTTLLGLGVLTAVAVPAAGAAEAPLDKSRLGSSPMVASGSGLDIPGADRSAAMPTGVEASSSGFYRIRVRNNNQRMETEFGSTENGWRIISSAGAGAGYLPSHWSIVPLSGGLYSFVNRNSGRCLDVPFRQPAPVVRAGRSGWWA